MEYIKKKSSSRSISDNAVLFARLALHIFIGLKSSTMFALNQTSGRCRYALPILRSLQLFTIHILFCYKIAILRHRHNYIKSFKILFKRYGESRFSNLANYSSARRHVSHQISTPHTQTSKQIPHEISILNTRKNKSRMPHFIFN